MAICLGGNFAKSVSQSATVSYKAIAMFHPRGSKLLEAQTPASLGAIEIWKVCTQVLAQRNKCPHLIRISTQSFKNVFIVDLSIIGTPVAFRVSLILRSVGRWNGFRVCSHGNHSYNALNVRTKPQFDKLIAYCEGKTFADGRPDCEDYILLDADAGGVVPCLCWSLLISCV